MKLLLYNSALDKVLNNWVFLSIFKHPFLTELGISIFLFPEENRCILIC